LLWRRLTRLAVFVAVTVAVNPLLNELVKVAVHRARPVLTDPVGHADGPAGRLTDRVHAMAPSPSGPVEATSTA
jgi:hypothetical protein